ncbi:uncharacterized protein LOC135366466 [Ornithodoros turicata]|uniref:uncharacterized protein LOC135366466 n=1 Tax=Ornithodoros turicata TaxID=34597 RepID=UPI003138B8CA
MAEDSWEPLFQPLWQLVNSTKGLHLNTKRVAMKLFDQIIEMNLPVTTILGTIYPKLKEIRFGKSLTLKHVFLQLEKVLQQLQMNYGDLPLRWDIDVSDSCQQMIDGSETSFLKSEMKNFLTSLNISENGFKDTEKEEQRDLFITQKAKMDKRDISTSITAVPSETVPVVAVFSESSLGSSSELEEELFFHAQPTKKVTGLTSLSITALNRDDFYSWKSATEVTKGPYIDFKFYQDVKHLHKTKPMDYWRHASFRAKASRWNKGNPNKYKKLKNLIKEMQRELLRLGNDTKDVRKSSFPQSDTRKA